MQVTMKGNQCIVTREPKDPKFRDTNWGSGESTLLYNVKKELIKQGYDLIKKRMWKDGHLVSDTCQYLRAKKPTDNPDKDIYVWDGNYQIRNAAEDFNKDGKVTYNVMTDVFKKEERTPTPQISL
jgi:hypothetical protein